MNNDQFGELFQITLSDGKSSVCLELAPFSYLVFFSDGSPPEAWPHDSENFKDWEPE